MVGSLFVLNESSGSSFQTSIKIDESSTEVCLTISVKLIEIFDRIEKKELAKILTQEMISWTIH
jgi:hypothetical protein